MDGDIRAYIIAVSWLVRKIEKYVVNGNVALQRYYGRYVFCMHDVSYYLNERKYSHPVKIFSAVMTNCYFYVCPCTYYSVYIHRVWKKMPLYFGVWLCQILTNFQNSFIDSLSSKFVVKQLCNIQPHFKRVATLPCEMFVLKNRHVPGAEWSELPWKLSHLKQLLKYSSSDVSTVLFTDEKYRYCGHIENPKESPAVRNCSNQEERRRASDSLAPLIHSTEWLWRLIKFVTYFLLTERLHIQSAFRHQSASYKWSRKHQFDTCRSRSWSYWGLLF